MTWQRPTEAEVICARKIAYRSKERALKAKLILEVAIRRGKADTPREPKAGVLSVYRCAVCGLWHVGHTTRPLTRRNR